MLPRLLPRDFTVSAWRRAMSPDETLACSIDDLAAPFVELAGANDDAELDAALQDDGTGWFSADDDSPDLGRTMAALDGRLRRIERWLVRASRSRRDEAPLNA